MPKHQMRVFYLLDRLFSRSYVAKFLVVAFVAICLPLLTVTLLFAINPDAPRYAFFIDLLITTVVGLGIMGLLLPRLLAPLDAALELLEDGSSLPEVDSLSQDASGQLLRRISEVLGRLRSSEQRYSSLFQAIPDGISCFDRQGAYTEVKLPSYFSYVQPDLIGKTPEDLYNPDMAAMIREARQRMWTTGEMQTYELERTANGKISHREVSIFPLSEHEGAALVRDISDRKHAQQRLHESESRFRSFFENSPNPCMILESDGVDVIGSIRTNQALNTFLGGIPANISTMKRADILAYIESVSHPDDWQQDFLYLSEVLAGERDSYRMEKRYLHTDGTWRWGDYNSTVLRDEDGNITRILATIQDITARKRAEQQAELAYRKLHTSEGMFRAFFEDSSTPCFIMVMPTETSQGQFLVNQAFRTFLGTPALEHNEMAFTETLAFNAQTSHPEDLALEQPLLEALLRGEQDYYSLEKRYFRPDGTIVWGSLRNHALHDDDGNVIMLLGITQDISEQKRTQMKLQALLEQLEASEAMFRAFFEGSGSAHSIINMENPDTPREDRLLVNRAYDHLMADTIVPTTPVRTLADIDTLNNAVTHPEDLMVENEHNHALVSGQRDNYKLEKRFLKRNGEVIWVVVTHSLIRQSDGTPNLLLSTIQDITDLKRTQERLSQALARLEASEAKFRAFFEGSGSAHSIINMQDPDTPRDDRLLANQAFKRLMADTVFADAPVRTSAEIDSLNQVLTPPEDLAVEAEYNRALMSGQSDSYRLEKRFLKRDGEVIWAVVTHSLIRQPDGNPNLLLSTVQDITDLKRTQDHLSQTLARLEDALRTKNMLMRETHHRVKNNLQVIASLLNLQSHLLSDETAKEALSESRKRVMAMAEIHELMHQSDVSNRIDFAQYLEELVALMRRSYSLDDITITLELASVTLPLDQAIPLALITNELVSNALKYAFPKGASAHERPTITIFLQQTDATVTLCVDDNGVGLHETDGEDDSLGMTIIKSLSGQLGGTLTFADKITHHQLPIAKPTLHDTPPDESGLQVMLCFPLADLQEA